MTDVQFWTLYVEQLNEYDPGDLRYENLKSKYIKLIILDYMKFTKDRIRKSLERGRRKVKNREIGFVRQIIFLLDQLFFLE